MREEEGRGERGGSGTFTRINIRVYRVEADQMESSDLQIFKVIVAVLGSGRTPRERRRREEASTRESSSPKKEVGPCGLRGQIR